MIPDGKFIEKLIANFTVKFVDFFLRKQLLLFIRLLFFGDRYYRILKWSERNMQRGKHSQIQIDIILVPSKMPNCAVSPDLFHNEISFSSTWNIPKHCFSRKTRSYLKLMRIYFVFWKDLILLLTIQKVCDWFRIL